MATATMKLIEEDVEGGGKEMDMDGIENDFAYNNNVHNANINIRLGFLRKVYGLLSIQLLITVVIAATFMTFEPLKVFIQENSWTLLLSFVTTMGTLIALYIKRRDHPVNLILLTIFTLAKAYTIGIIVSMYDVATVLEALFITLTVMIGLTIYTFQSKRDLSISSSGYIFHLILHQYCAYYNYEYFILMFNIYRLIIGLWILLLGGFMQIFIQSTIFELLLCIAGAALMSMFIVFDTRLIMHTLSPEEYILATINIYLDVINLFLYVLRILAASKQ
ncbi:protein lifeguard 4-like isoform X1 [Calliopsis andreniformis]|uniref:protein lifeguard 4-like isoform X1 n=1 Tax=Calliopsis andreniformis TaxID=337506 RepID=UPI003FCED1D7